MKARITDVITIAAAMTGNTASDITGRKRHRGIVVVRAAIVWLCRFKLDNDYSYTQIGTAMGGRDHSSIINLSDQMEYYVSLWPQFQDFTKALEKAIAEAPPFVPEGYEPEEVFAVKVVDTGQKVMTKRAKKGRERMNNMRVQKPIDVKKAEPKKASPLLAFGRKGYTKGITPDLEAALDGRISKSDKDYFEQMRIASAKLRDAILAA